MISGCRQRFSDVIPHGDGAMEISYISVSASQGLHMNFIVLHLAMVLTLQIYIKIPNDESIEIKKSLFYRGKIRKKLYFQKMEEKNIE